jgi:hypothetical protein
MAKRKLGPGRPVRLGVIRDEQAPGRHVQRKAMPGQAGPTQLSAGDYRSSCFPKADPESVGRQGNGVPLWREVFDHACQAGGTRGRGDRVSSHPALGKTRPDFREISRVQSGDGRNDPVPRVNEGRVGRGQF